MWTHFIHLETKTICGALSLSDTWMEITISYIKVMHDVFQVQWEKPKKQWKWSPWCVVRCLDVMGLRMGRHWPMLGRRARERGRSRGGCWCQAVANAWQLPGVRGQARAGRCWEVVRAHQGVKCQHGTLLCIIWNLYICWSWRSVVKRACTILQ